MIGVNMKRILGIIAALLALGAVPAHAALISSDAAIKPASERDRVRAMLERPEVTRELQKMGIAPSHAEGRVQAMSDTEVAQLAGRLDALPAGGAITNDELLLIIIIVLLVAILI
jgi:hypothetical protein